MFTVTIGKKVYKVETVSARALYEMQPALETWAKLIKATEAIDKGEEPKDALTIKEAMDALIKWFVIFCGNQFSSDDILDNYPQDSLITDIGLALRTAQTHTTAALTAFPTTARRQKQTPENAQAQTAARSASRIRYMLTLLKKAVSRKK